MPDDSNTASRQEVFKTNKGKVTSQIKEAEKIEQKVKKEEIAQEPPYAKSNSS
ncbi:MAG: hypothetical protein AAB553_07845 [Patescibacteria group bacterium]